jgi:acetylornithine deacetylase/succinyl-diaminopimelate desuccinylase-like protein
MISISIQKKILQLSKKIMRMPSVEHNLDTQEECIAILCDEFKDVFTAKHYMFKGHPAVVLSTTNRKNVDIILSGHIDVVDAPSSLFTPRVVKDRLYGRGAYDMKAALVSCMYAIAEYKRRGGNLDIAVMITSDEETSGYGTQQLLNKHGYRSKFTFIPDGGTETGIVLRQKGFAQFKVTFKGTTAHASEQWSGKNPIEQVQELCETVKKKYPGPTKKDQWQTSMVPTRLETTGSLNQIPLTASVYFDMRYVRVSDYTAALKLLQSKTDNKGGVDIVAENGMFYANENNPYVQTLFATLQKHSKKKVSFMYENGTSDAIFFTDHGIPAALFRPVGGGAHQDGEWVSIASLIDMSEVFLDFLNTLNKS